MSSDSDVAASSGMSSDSDSDSDSSRSDAGASSDAGAVAVQRRSGTHASLLFEPFRAIGVVADDNRAVTHRLGEHTFVTASIGKAWQSFRCDKLSLALVSPPLPADIRCATRTHTAAPAVCCTSNALRRCSRARVTVVAPRADCAAVMRVRRGVISRRVVLSSCACAAL